MALSTMTTGGGVDVPALTRTDSGPVKVPESVASFDDGSAVPSRVTPANPLPVTFEPATVVTGTMSAVAQTVVGPTDRGYMGYVVDVSSDASGSGITLQFEVSPDGGTTWRQITCPSATGQNYSTASESLGVSGSRILLAPTNGMQFRVRMSARLAGTATAIIAGVLAPVIQANQPIAGTVSLSTGNGLQLAPATFSSGGLTVFGTGSGGSAASTNATSVKTSNGRLYSVQVTNTSASTKWVKFYNKASAPTVGTDTPVARYAIPAGWCGELFDSPMGRAFSTGIAYAITGGGADSDTTAVAAGDVYLVGDYA